MSTINYTLNWHPRFRVEDLGLDSLIFLGEQKQFLISRAEYEPIEQVVSQKGQLSDYIFQSNDMLASVTALEKINQLVEEGLLVADTPAPYHTPDFDFDIDQVSYQGHSVYLLSQDLDESIWRAILEGSGLSDQTAMVIVDDYLDPRLSWLAEKFKTEKQAWMLCQPRGERPMLGPFFVPETDNACYHCLRSHLVRNRPVREWHRIQSAREHHLPVPVLNSQKSQHRAVDMFNEYLQSSSKAERALLGSLYVLDGELEEASTYAVIRRKNCERCGHPVKLTQAPFILEDATVLEDRDGGFRSTSRQKTIEKLQPLINPITGYLVDFKEVSSSDKEQMAIYQAAYFQNSFFNEYISADTFVQLSLGKGVAKEQAMTSALGEAFERQAAQFTGAEAVTFGRADSLEHRAYLPQDLSPFSQQQYAGFEDYTHASLQNPQWAQPMDEHEEIHWIKGWSLSRNEFVYFPFAHCIANSPFEDHRYSVYTHNGNAAGNNKEEALLQGLLELIERDNTAIWWYNQVPRPEISKEVIPVANREFIVNTLDAEWDFWLLDISADMEVVTCVCVGAHKTTRHFVMGFGSHLDVQIACQRALTEMYQLIEIRHKVTGPFDFESILPHPFLFPSKKLEKKGLKDYQVTPRNIRDGILHLKDELESVDLDLCVVDYSRPDVPLSTLKVIVPGLCHFWPQFAARRLYEVPVKMGWLSEPSSEYDLNPMSLYL